MTINGKEITVTEEVYRAYKRPIWREKKRIQRNIDYFSKRHEKRKDRYWT
jgi:hypothetical protein